MKYTWKNNLFSYEVKITWYIRMHVHIHFIKHFYFVIQLSWHKVWPKFIDIFLPSILSQLSSIYFVYTLITWTLFWILTYFNIRKYRFELQKNALQQFALLKWLWCFREAEYKMSWICRKWWHSTVVLLYNVISPLQQTFKAKTLCICNWNLSDNRDQSIIVCRF